MIRRLFVVVLFCASILPVGAQINLVKNPSFEHFIQCPHAYSEVSFANYWSALVDTTYVLDSEWIYYDSAGSINIYTANCVPYYCNACDNPIADPSLLATVPLGYFWYHYPRTGKGMMGVLMYSVNVSYNVDDRMYLQGRLHQTLQAGKPYCVTFYVVNTNSSGAGCNHIGAYFDDGTIDTTHECGPTRTNDTPQIRTDSIITDTLNWTRIQGTFVATGTERFMTIGNFSDSAHTSILEFNSTGEPMAAFYLIDDVSVIATDAVADAGPDRVTSAIGDSVWVGDTTADYLPCYWYINGVLADSNISGFKVLPDSTTFYVMALDVCGNVTYDTAVVWVYPTGLGTVSAMYVLLYPNPASTQLTVEGARGCALTLVDAVGQTVWSLREAGMKQVVPLEGLAPGVYTLVAANAVTGERTCRMVEKR